ncbi:hypothetical protein LP419_18710 [Massilia sp. H-1]|nr:hypothetical protein LP419_18710 [Massilia sp. H-1]
MGGSWGTVMQVAFLFGALILLVVILFSGTFRAWLKVFISKHFYSYNYDYREEWLRFTRTLSEHGPGLGVRTIQAVGELVESPGGVLFLRAESGAFEPESYWHVLKPAPWPNRSIRPFASSSKPSNGWSTCRNTTTTRPCTRTWPCPAGWANSSAAGWSCR